MENYYTENYPDVEIKGNPIAGILGAFLFSFAGVALWFVIYQLGFIAGATGIIMYGATIKGYERFGKKVNLFASITCFIITIIMLIFAELSCVAFEIYKAYKNEYGITIFDAFNALPEFLAYPDVFKGVKIDLVLGCLLTFVSVILGYVKNRAPGNTEKIKSSVKNTEMINENRKESETPIKKKSVFRTILSMWPVIFTFGAFFTNWLTFLYLGFRLKKPKMLLWSIFYITPLVLTMTLNDNSSDLYALFFLALAIVSSIMGIIHASKVCVRNIKANT